MLPPWTGDIMADVNIDMMLSDSTRSIGRRRGEVQALNQDLERTRKLMASQSSAGIDPSEREGYDKARGAIGTGAAGRDFANQAQGLGGVVRLYATFAANIFAVSAAFTALSNAMDTANMVKGLDQLGAASGVALGSLSKRLVTATDGAVSLREAMEATVKASSAGLNTDQILKLGNVAKSASLALGLNMPDALSRLSRGISKLEPELLDELGIFVRIDDAVSKYALSIGKSTASLTDFERRQAFANAVLDQGAKKFGDIKIDSNPYTKLAATLKDLSFAVLDFVNKGLTPFVKILADNSQVLGLIIGAIALKLLKTAIPAFGEFGAGMVRAADEASKSAKRINTAFGEAYVERWNTKLRIPELEKEVQKIDTLLKQAGTAGIQKGERGFTAATRISTGQATTKDFTTINNLIKERTELYQKEIEASGGKETASTRALKREIDGYNNLIALNKSYTATSKDLADARAKFSVEAIEKEATFSEKTRQRIVDAANSKAVALRALSQVSANTMEMGFSGAMDRLKKDLDNNVGAVRRYTTLTVGYFAAATTSIGMFISSIQMWIGVALFVVTGLAALLSWLSNTKKEAELTSEAFDRLTGAAKNSREVLERISKLDPLERISVESIQARATGFKELGDSLELSVSRAFNQLEKMNWANNIVEFFKGIFDADVETKLAENVTDSIVQGFKLAEPTRATQEAKAIVEGILKTSINSADLGAAVEALVTSGNRQALAELSKEVQKLGNNSAISAAKGTELKDSISKLTTGIQEFNKGLLPSDSLSKYAQDAQVAAQKLKIALDDPIQSLNAMRQIAKSPDALTIFPPSTASELAALSSQLDDIAIKMQTVSELSAEDLKRLKEIDVDIKVKSQREAGFRDISEQQKREIAQLEEERKKIEDKPLRLKAEIEATELKPIKELFDKGVRESLVQSATIMGSRIAAEMNKAQTAVLSALASLAGDTEVGIRMRAELEKKIIDAQGEVAKQSFELALRVEALRYEMERTRLEARQKDILSRAPDRINVEEANAVANRLKELSKLESIVKTRTFPSSSKQLLAADRTQSQGGGTSTVSMEEIALIQKFEALSASAAGQAAQKRVVELNKEVALLANYQKVQKENETVTNRLAEIDRERIVLRNSLLQRSELEVLSEKEISAQKKINQDFETKSRDINNQFIREYSIGEKIYAEGVRLRNLQTQAEGSKLMNLAIEKRDRDINLNSQEKSLALDTNSITILQQRLTYLAKEEEIRRNSLQLMERMNLESIQAEETTTLELLNLDLEYRKTQGFMTDEQLRKEELLLKLRDLELKKSQTIAKAQLDSRQKIAQLDVEFEDPRTSPARRQAILEEMLALDLRTTREVEGIEKLTEARRKQLELETSISTRQKAYADVFEKAMDNMTDAIMDFARTGKLSFKSLIDTMIAELIRFEMRRMMTQSFGTGRGIFSALTSAIGSMLGGGQFGVTPIGHSGYGGQGYIGGGAAKGAYFDGISSNWATGAVQKFGRGGMFTNSIVDSPTVFKFAKGTGLMGEAGPEAIMPLKRDNQGNLGVRGNSGSVEVVVNNYTSERAEARETMDNRGNRRIEVVVGDMVAGEMTRTGSNSQRAVRGTFGLQPQLIRR